MIEFDSLVHHRLGWIKHFSSGNDVEWHVWDKKKKWKKKEKKWQNDKKDRLKRWCVGEYVLKFYIHQQIFYEILVFIFWVTAIRLWFKWKESNWICACELSPTTTTAKKVSEKKRWLMCTDTLCVSQFEKCYFKRTTRVITLSMAFGTFIVELWFDLQCPRPRPITLPVYVLHKTRAWWWDCNSVCSSADSNGGKIN